MPVATQTQNETDIRMGILNTLLTTPHRRIEEVYDIHKKMIADDPRFYVRLAAWYNKTGDVRDHKEAFVICLCLSDFEGHRDVGLAMLRELPPYQVGRVISFIAGYKVPEYVDERVNKPVKGRRGRSTIKVVRKRTGKMLKKGLWNTVPQSLKTEVTRYLREREASPEWFDACVLQARKQMKNLYRTLHIKPSERANDILFKNQPPADSSVAQFKNLVNASTPAEQAEIIIKHKIPYRVASTVISAMTPTVIYALIEVMSGQELINNLGSLKKRGAFDNPDLKDAINKKLDLAKKDKKVAGMKTSVAGKSANLDKETQAKLDEVGDTRVKAKGKIKASTALLIDKSGSMSQGIEIGKRLGSMISAIAESDFYVYAFDTMAHPIESKGDDLASWEKAFHGIYASGGTSCGVGIRTLDALNQAVEQIIMVSDQCEHSSPPFLTSLQEYGKKFGMPRMVFVNCGGYHTRKLEGLCQRNGVDYEAYDFDGDYYSLTNLIPFLTKKSKVDLLIDIMAWRLPERRAA